MEDYHSVLVASSAALALNFESQVVIVENPIEVTVAAKLCDHLHCLLTAIDLTSGNLSCERD